MYYRPQIHTYPIIFIQCFYNNFFFLFVSTTYNTPQSANQLNQSTRSPAYPFSFYSHVCQHANVSAAAADFRQQRWRLVVELKQRNPSTFTTLNEYMYNSIIIICDCTCLAKFVKISKRATQSRLFTPDGKNIVCYHFVPSSWFPIFFFLYCFDCCCFDLFLSWWNNKKIKWKRRSWKWLFFFTFVCFGQSHKLNPWSKSFSKDLGRGSRACTRSI